MADSVIDALVDCIETAGGTVTERPKSVIAAVEMLNDTIAGGGGKSLGITDAVPGQIPVVKTVDEDGKPTEWEAQTPSTVTYTLTIALATTDGTTVTGQTVKVREGDDTGVVIGEQTYSGEPVTFSLPGGFTYYVEASDTLRMHGAPSTASGIMTGAKSITLTYAALASVLVKDEQTGRYTNDSLADFWARQRDGKVYGTSQPKSSPVLCTKTDDNANIAAPTPGWVGHPAVDPYVTGKVGPCIRYDVNGGADPDGSQFVKSIRGIDNDFALDGSNGDVFEMTPTYYRREVSGNDAVTLQVTDTPREGYVLRDHAKLPDGTVRPYMLHAKYAGCIVNGVLHSYSGYPVGVRVTSHNSYITQCDTANTGYSGKNTADLQYVQDMWLIKNATKDMQTVMMGCVNYNLNYAITVAETGVKRAIIAKSNAANLIEGSWVTIGTSDHGIQVMAPARITSIEDYDESNSIVNIDAASTFDTAVDNKLSVEPWGAGRTDLVEGDGAYSQAGLLSGKEPFVFQGIEMFVGCTEVLGNVIISNDGTSGWVPYVNHDSRNEATSLTNDYVSCGAALPTTDTEGWKYPLYAESHEGLQYGTTTGGSTTTGLSDGHYTNKLETTGAREWQSGGNSNGSRNAGLWFVNASHGLSSADWPIGPRLSAVGRSQAADEEEEEQQAA